MPFYILETKGSWQSIDLARIGAGPQINGIDWYGGSRFAKPIPEPLRFDLDPQTSGGMPWFFDHSIPLMHTKMLVALREAGVDNLDLYTAIVRDPVDGEEWREYKAVNVVGKIAAADLGASRFDTTRAQRLVSVAFESLVLDETKIGGALLFRLAECVSAIVVHEKVREQCLARGIQPLGFIPPADWMS